MLLPPMHAKILILAALLSLAVPLGAADKPAPYHYEPATSTLTGVVKNDRQYFGPPGFGENPKEDAKEVPERLVLDAPISIVPEKGDPTNHPVSEVGELQIVKGDAVPDLAPYLDRRVTITGKLFEAHTGHHHTPALIAAETILLEKKP